MVLYGGGVVFASPDRRMVMYSSERKQDAHLGAFGGSDATKALFGPRMHNALLLDIGNYSYDEERMLDG